MLACGTKSEASLTQWIKEATLPKVVKAGLKGKYINLYGKQAEECQRTKTGNIPQCRQCDNSQPVSVYANCKQEFAACEEERRPKEETHRKLQTRMCVQTERKRLKLLPAYRRELICRYTGLFTPYVSEACRKMGIPVTPKAGWLDL